VSLGAYEITPLEAAGAYTVFANGGNYVQPSFVSLVRDKDGRTVQKNKVVAKKALDPRVAFLMTDLMEEVLRSGTAAGVRAKYTLDFPVAGKTGTSHDGWFAGYTSELICVVWVGFDDNKELDLEGAHSAAPIWAEFMKRAVQYREYRDTKPFVAPSGVVSVAIDPMSGYPATPACPTSRNEVFIAGTEPVGSCPLHGGRSGTHIAGWDATTPEQVELLPPQPSTDVKAPAPAKRAPTTTAQAAQPPATPAPAQKKDEKKGFFRRLINVFK
jgi:penicillin-binding protein 1B